MKESSLASQSRYSTKGGSMSPKPDSFTLLKRLWFRSRSPLRVDVSERVKETDRSSLFSPGDLANTLRQIVLQHFYAERELTHNSDSTYKTFAAFEGNVNQGNGYALRTPGGLHALNGAAPGDPASAPRCPIWKRIFDLSILACTIWAWLPLMMLAVCLVKVSSAGPSIYKQRRVGYRGREFMIFKFRTMHVNAETRTHERYFEHLMISDSPMTKLDTSDPRLITGGRFLRLTGLDELPQIFNVIRGDMSLVGPRPCTVAEYEHYRPCERERVEAPPGITGYWQVNGKNKTTFREMIAMDKFYIENMSLRLDLAVILKTIPSILREVTDLPRSAPNGQQGPMRQNRRQAGSTFTKSSET